MTLKQQYLELFNPLSSKEFMRKLVKIAEDYKKAGVKEEADAKKLAYHERNMLVCYLSKLYPSHRSKHDLKKDKSWDREWETIICVHTPQGQATWHVHKSEKKLFMHLKNQKDHWDGHTSEEKYERLLSL